MNTNLLKAYTGFILFLFISGCGPKALYDHTKSIPDGVWKKKDLITFKVEVSDTVHIHKFYLNLRQSTDYRFSNLFLFIHTTFPDGTQGRDTVECTLADKSGKWLGKGITNFRDNQVLLRRGLRFPQTGQYIFELEQAMREPELEGIEDIGLRIIKE
jgi:gliding motility-associated lipoprotein GldH